MLTPAAKLAVRVNGLFPGTTAVALGAINRLLPRAVRATPPLAGSAVSTELDSRLLRGLTVLGRSAARRYQQHPGAHAAP